MKLSTAARYAVRSMVALSRLSEGNNQPISLEQVAQNTSISRKYLEQLARKLKSASLVTGVSGRNGGYLLAHSPDDIRIGQIVEAAIGPINIVGCVLDPDSCIIADCCECRTLYCVLNNKIREILYGFTLTDLATARRQETLRGDAIHEVSDLSVGFGEWPAASKGGCLLRPAGPVTGAAPAPHERSLDMGDDTGKKLVLVVEDNPDERSYLTTLLEDSGYRVVSAQDGEEALGMVREEVPDLVTLDMSMPKKSGLRFYRELKEDAGLASTPVVVVTAVTGFAGDPEGFRNFLNTREQVTPPEGFVAKPIDKGELLEALSGLLD